MKVMHISLKELLDSNRLVRGLAMLGIVVCHIPFAHPFWERLKPFTSAGKLAVSIFLFSSGFMLQHQANTLGRKINIITWVRRRAGRIYPLYWGGLILALAFGFLFGNRGYPLGTIVVNLLGTPLLFGEEVVQSGYTAPFWFISALILCYALFLFTYRIARKELLVLIALILSVVALNTSSVMVAAALGFPAFFMGMLSADRIPHRRDSANVVSCFAVFLILIGLLAFIYKHDYFITLNESCIPALEGLGCALLTLIALPALYVVAVIYKVIGRRSPYALKAILGLSGLSYGIYCVHEPLLVVVDRLSESGFPWLSIPCYFVAVLCVAWCAERITKRLSQSIRGSQTV